MCPLLYSAIVASLLVARACCKGLTDLTQELLVPRALLIGEAFAALDALELARAQLIVLLLVVTDHSRLALEGAFDGELGTLLDELAISLVRGSGARVVAALLHERLLRADPLCKFLSKVLAHVHSVKLDVAEGVARHLSTVRLELAHDITHAGTLGDEDVNAVVRVHDGLEALRLCLDVNRHLRHIHGVHAQALLVHEELRQEGVVGQVLVVGVGRGRGEPAAVAAHDLVHDEHARIGGGLGDHVGKELCAVLGSSHGPKGLADGDHVVVDGLRHADNTERIVVLGEEGSECGSGGVRVVAADGVQHVNAILHELVGGHLLRVLALLDETALDAVLHVGELHARIADGRAAVELERGGVLADGVGHFDRVAKEQALVAALVANDPGRWGVARVCLDEVADGGGQARGDATGGEQRDALGRARCVGRHVVGGLCKRRMRVWGDRASSTRTGRVSLQDSLNWFGN
mmetsp:Transcript_6486/g.18901  ORF Transcript_6486/g.18901 Transcript_6486/m.18901 type:complete len:464 (+) Transcript_6486:232-1623(+)